MNKIKEILSAHKVICFPTETVMGLGVFYNDFEAYSMLNKIKNRAPDKPYTMMIKSIDDIALYCQINTKIMNVIKAFMPGSLTILVKAKEIVPDFVTHSTGIIGIRIPSNKEALEVLQEAELPLLVPSCNKAGEKPAYTSEEAKEMFKDEVSLYIEGKSISNVPSTIVNLVGDEPILIREGQITLKEILEIWNA